MTLAIQISISLGEAPASQPVLPPDMDFVRVLHECELPPERRYTPPKMPQVRPLFPNHFVQFGQPWQMVSWSLNKLLNAGNLTAVYNEYLWIANGTGFGNTPRANYFTMEDLEHEQIKVEDLTCGGNVLHVLGETLFKTNAGKVPCWIVEVLDYRNVPTAAWLEAHPWLITTATKLDPAGEPTRFPQGQQPNGYQPGVRHPLVADPTRYTVIVIEKWRVTAWTESYPPDPLRVYNRWSDG